MTIWSALWWVLLPDMLVFRKEKQYMERRWKDVQVGDFVKVMCNEIVPADLLLMHTSDPSGVCLIETSNLDGETNLKQRRALSGICVSVSDTLFPPMRSAFSSLCDWHFTIITRTTTSSTDMIYWTVTVKSSNTFLSQPVRTENTYLLDNIPKGLSAAVDSCLYTA